MGKALTNVSNYKTKKCPEDRQKQLIDLIDMIKPDGVMLSFCERLEDIHYMQSLFPGMKVIPKVETMKGADSVSTFYECVDEICLGRGDLGIINQYDCARVQDGVLHIAHEQQKGIIIGTGVLQSLSQGKVIPARSELTDIHYIKKYKEASIMLAAGIVTNETYLKRAMQLIRGIV